jgi:AcrR family transcriptional regulator
LIYIGDNKIYGVNAMPLVQTRSRTQKGIAADKAKERLVQAGVELFDRYSFEGVSTRVLADRAKVNVASIQYYFGSKEGLYLAVARHIVQRVNSRIGPHLTRINQVLSEEKPDRERDFRLLCELMDHVLSQIVGEDEPKTWIGIFTREQSDPTGAFEILYDGVMEPIHRCLRRLVARLLALSADDREVKLRAYAIFGEAVIFHLARAEVVRSLDWSGYSAETGREIGRVVLEHMRAVFGVPPEALQTYFDSLEQ